MRCIARRLPSVAFLDNVAGELIEPFCFRFKKSSVILSHLFGVGPKSRFDKMSPGGKVIQRPLSRSLFRNNNVFSTIAIEQSAKVEDTIVWIYTEMFLDVC